jgi:hypothetical protein
LTGGIAARLHQTAGAPVRQLHLKTGVARLVYGEVGRAVQYESS